MEALEEENIFRQMAKVIRTSSGDRKIPVVARPISFPRSVISCSILVYAASSSAERTPFSFLWESKNAFAASHAFAKLSHLMDAETWMDANKAVELGFADDIMARAKTEPGENGEGDTNGEENGDGKKPSVHSSMLFSRRAADNALLNKVIARYGEKKPKAGIGEQAKIPAPVGKGTPKTETGRSVDALMERLNLLKR